MQVKQKKNIWVINHYASSPDTGMGGRSFYLCQELSRINYNVTLFAARFNHKLHSPISFSEDFHIDTSYGFKFVRINVLGYEFSSSKKRILNWFIFNKKLDKNKTQFHKKPHVILCSSPSLVSFLVARKLSKKYNAKLIFEVRDIWPLTLIEIGKFSPWNPFIFFLQLIEDKAYKEADLVISNLPNSWKHMVDRGLHKKKFTWIPNGYNFPSTSQIKTLPQKVINEIPTGKFIIGYTGAIGKSNALEYLVDAAYLLKEEKDIFFMIIGSGKEKKHLIEKIKKLKLKNFSIQDPIKKDVIPTVLSKFDICYIGLTKDPIFKFGVSPNKLFDYLAAGKPIIYSIDSGEYMPINDANAGLSTPPEDSRAIAKAILTIKSMPSQQREKLGKNAKAYVEKKHNYSNLAKQLSILMEKYSENDI